MQFNITPVVKQLLIINVGLVLVTYLGIQFFHIDLNNIFGLHSVFSSNFYPWQPLTYMFMHSSTDIFHLIFNMITLAFVGSRLELFWGGKRLLIFYLVTGVGAGLLYCGVNAWEVSQVRNHQAEFIQNPSPELFTKFTRTHFKSIYNENIDWVRDYSDHPDDPGFKAQAAMFVNAATQAITESSMVGASGAIFGLLMAMGLLFPNSEVMFPFLFIPIKVKYLVLLLGLGELYAQYKNVPGDTVSHYTHLSGMLVGFMMVRYWSHKRDRFY